MKICRQIFTFTLLVLLAGCAGNPVEDTSSFPDGLEAKEAPMLAKTGCR